jgi:hypothetical protein
MTNSEHKLRLLFDSEYQEKYENYEKFLKWNRDWYFEYIKSSRGAPHMVLIISSCVLLSVVVGGQIILSLVTGVGVGLAVPFLLVVWENRKQAKELGLKSVRLW